ncbi:MAG: response regulator, partial [Clostridia bacterium]
MYKLILADDERKIRTVLNSIIDWKGLNLTKVCECDNGDQLVQKVLEEKPDIVLSDMRMPGIHGKELLEKLREIDKNLRVIVISGFDDFTYLKQAVVSGVEDYIMKPIDIKELNKALVNAIAKINENEKYNEHIDANNKKAFALGREYGKSVKLR